MKELTARSEDRDEGWQGQAWGVSSRCPWISTKSLTRGKIVSLENVCDPIGLGSTLGVMLIIYKTYIQCFQ